MPISKLHALIEAWLSHPRYSEGIRFRVTLPAQPGQAHPVPPTIPNTLRQALEKLGIYNLYLHQISAWQSALSGEHIMIAAGVGSGKSLCYHLPVLHSWLETPNATALYLFPTKALAYDQYQFLQTFLDALPFSPTERKSFKKHIVTYDGDSTPSQRKRSREIARLLLTNPDMLHYGILPYHPYWQEFLANLKYIILDEAHLYRGAFGSHVANLIRRLKRIAALYGANPRFLMTSGTIGNPLELAQTLIEAPVTLISNDTAPKPERHLLFYNPPFENEVTGIRRDATDEVLALAQELLDHNVQTLVFLNSRRGVEIALRTLRESLPNTEGIEAYRSGYLPQDRRWIEQSLREQTNRLVFTTNALELGVDIGGVEAIIMIGYPGSVTAYTQRIGRAGRKGQPALGLLIASDNPLDQYIIHHPEHVLERLPEKVILNPDNPVILYQHLKCASYEKPFKAGESFGALTWETIEPYINVLAHQGILRSSFNRFTWLDKTQPHRETSLRGSAHSTIKLHVQAAPTTSLLGEVDYESAYWMVHPGAIYLHRGDVYGVETLDLESGKASLKPTHSDYYTEPLLETQVTAYKAWESQDFSWGTHACGELHLTTWLKGFKKRSWDDHTVLEQVSLDFPPLTLETTGYWLSLNSRTVKQLVDQGLWTNTPNNYGPNWEQQRQLARARDHYTCQQCGARENGNAFHVHHRVPFRRFSSPEEANRLENLITLCPRCHRRLEKAVWIRSGLSAVRHLLHHLAPLFVLCDHHDLGSFMEPRSKLSHNQPTLVFYDTFQGGLGYALQFFDRHKDWFESAFEVITHCTCQNGCPSCVGPAPEQGSGGKEEAKAILRAILEVKPAFHG
ncbi:MAG: DEAD/DEAH box helicase [Thermanaerothrix sp.]|uniref:DEAD/DEAH box helicase n=1 Tax=Thermanaerothrix sp. TaxID=2972675 RepID=UPI003C7E7352